MEVIQDLYVGNNEALLGEIKEDLNKWTSRGGRQNRNGFYFLPINLWFSEIPIKISVDQLFVDINM